MACKCFCHRADRGDIGTWWEQADGPRGLGIAKLKYLLQITMTEGEPRRLTLRISFYIYLAVTLRSLRNTILLHDFHSFSNVQGLGHEYGREEKEGVE